MRKLLYDAVSQRLGRTVRLCVRFDFSTFFCPSLSLFSLAEMAYNHTRPTERYNDPFGDSALDEPFSTTNHNHNDSKTFVTYTSGVSAGGPNRTHPLAGSTEAESLAADYRQHNTSPSSFETPGRLPTPSLRLGALSNPNDIMTNVPYRDGAFRPPSVIEKSDAPLVHNAADMGRSSSYQDLGMEFITSRIVAEFMGCAEYAEPSGNDSNSVSEKGTPLRSFLGAGKYPMEQRIEDKKRGIPRQKHPFVGVSFLYRNVSLLIVFLVYALTIAMVGVFINELVVNSRAQGTPVSFKVSQFIHPANCSYSFPACRKSHARTFWECAD